MSPIGINGEKSLLAMCIAGTASTHWPQLGVRHSQGRLTLGMVVHGVAKQFKQLAVRLHPYHGCRTFVAYRWFSKSQAIKIAVFCNQKTPNNTLKASGIADIIGTIFAEFILRWFEGVPGGPGEGQG